MTKIQLSLINFPHHEILSSILNDFSNDFEFTADGVFRRIIPPLCPDCGFPMSHNGFNTYRKRILGEANIGRYLCGACGKSVEEDRTFWNNLKAGFFDIITEICLRLRLNHASYELIEQIMSFIYPCDKDTVRNIVQSAIEEMKVPAVRDIRFVHYDEQHPKAGRNQKYRLTLLDSISRQVIADELFDSKDAGTVEDFLRRNLDTHKPIFIITDLYRGYSDIFKRVFGNKATHQLCLLHLNKLIVRDFPRKTSIEQELVKYRLLNIFYNRQLEIEYLSCLIDEEKAMLQKSPKEYKAWIKEAKRLFYELVHNLELKRRREGKNLEPRTYYEALKNFKDLLGKIDSFEAAVRRRLTKIEELWPKLTAFYFVDNAPATNNPIENYYSVSLKTHRKNQLEETGIEDQMKLSALKRSGILGKPKRTLLDAFFMFIPFLDTG
ncbi:MAG: MULE transposase domain protein [Methanosaeta sp. PtaB.Bin087]|nr:MAG: MULE transposase domain protein [Methanosaeta sp. PtaB.Bin087]